MEIQEESSLNSMLGVWLPFVLYFEMLLELDDMIY